MLTAKEFARRAEAKRKADQITIDLQIRIEEQKARLDVLEANAEVMARKHGPGHPGH